MTAAFTHPPVYSEWFDPALQAPWEPGVYEVETGNSETRFSYWGGAQWNRTARTVDDTYAVRLDKTFCTITRWRGIVPPSRLPRFVSESWSEACARVPELRPLEVESVSDSAAKVFTLADCMPGYDLLSVLPRPTVFVYRRRDPA